MARVPALGRMHNPSCDFTALVSPQAYREFDLPSLRAEIKQTTRDIVHLDGKRIFRHLDMILELPEIVVNQWVQRVGADHHIMLWLDGIKNINWPTWPIVTGNGSALKAAEEGAVLLLNTDESTLMNVYTAYGSKHLSQHPALDDD
jgi:hypothetical protein